MKKIPMYFMLIILIAMCIMVMMSSVALAADGSEGVTVSQPAAESAAAMPYINIDVAAVAATLVAMLVLATIIETIAEWIKSQLTKNPSKQVWLCITSLIGIGCSILFRVNIFAAMGFTGGMAAIIVGEVFTGIAVGAGSSFIHKLEAKMDAVKNTGNVLTTAATANNDTSSDSGVNSPG